MSNNGESPSVDALLVQARNEPQHHSRSALREYLPVVEVLRNKGLTWQQIADWLRDATGDSFTYAAVQGAAAQAKKRAAKAKTA